MMRLQKLYHLDAGSPHPHLQRNTIGSLMEIARAIMSLVMREKLIVIYEFGLL